MILQEILKAFVLIFIAEMGDKTQILAMAFATRFEVKKVMLGIFLGVLLNHGLAVILGSYMSNIIPTNTIQIVAGFAFVGFALWTLKIDDEEEESESAKSKFGPVVTVATAFFIGELGDKTQLAAITLSSDASFPLAILCGTVLGMLVTGGIGIIIGKQLGDRIPELAIKLVASSIFLIFGVTKLYQTVPSVYLSAQNITMFSLVLVIAVAVMVRPIIEMRRKGKTSSFIKIAKELYDFYHKAEEDIESICLGEHNCGVCQGDKCVIGYTRNLIKNGMGPNSPVELAAFMPSDDTLQKEYDKGKVIDSLKLTLNFLKDNPDDNIHEIRKNFELILFGKSISEISSWDEYSKALEEMDKEISDRIFDRL